MLLLLICGVVAAVAIGAFLFQRAFVVCRNEAARRILEKDRIAYGILILCGLALWIVGSNPVGVMPAFDIYVPCLLMVLAVLLPRVSLKYARGHCVNRM